MLSPSQGGLSFFPHPFLVGDIHRDLVAAEAKGAVFFSAIPFLLAMFTRNLLSLSQQGSPWYISKSPKMRDCRRRGPGVFSYFVLFLFFSDHRAAYCFSFVTSSLPPIIGSCLAAIKESLLSHSPSMKPLSHHITWPEVGIFTSHVNMADLWLQVLVIRYNKPALPVCPLLLPELVC